MLTRYGKDILFYILSNPNPISGKALAVTFRLAQNTISKEIKLINDHLKDYGCHIRAEKLMGYSFVSDDLSSSESFTQQFRYDYKRMYYTSNENELAHRIIRILLIENKPVSIDALADQCLCSRSTLNRNLGEIRNLLSRYELNLQRKSSGIIVNGSEWNKRQCLIYEHKLFIHDEESYDSEEFLSLFSYEKIPGLYNVLRDRFVDLVSDNDYSIPYVEIPKIINYMVLCLSRRNYFGKVEFNDLQKETIAKHKLFRLVSSFILQISEELNLDFDETDIMGIAILMLCYKALRLDNKGRKNDSKYLDITKEFIAYVNENYLMQEDFDGVFINMMSDYFYLLNYRILFHVVIDEELTASSGNANIVSLELCELFKTFCFDKYHISLSKVDILGSYIIFDDFIIRKNLHRYKPKAIVASIYGEAYSELLNQRIQKTYPDRFARIDTADLTDLVHISLKDYDILFTDYYSAKISFPILSVVSVDLDSKINKEDISRKISSLISYRLTEIFNRSNIHNTVFRNEQDLSSELGADGIRLLLQNTVAFFKTNDSKESLNIFINDKEFFIDDKPCRYIVAFSRGKKLEVNLQINEVLRKISHMSISDLENISNTIL